MAAVIETQVGCEIKEDGTVKVGDLGLFSMRDIYDALASTNKYQLDKLVEPKDAVQIDNEANDSDCSWTLEEENSEFYLQMRRRLDAFSIAADQTNMTTEPLSRRERRFVHATAQIMNLGHASLGPPRSKNRRMVIYKSSHDTLPEIRQDRESRGISWGAFDDNASPSIISFASSQRKRKRLERVDGGYPCQYYPCTKLFDRASERNKHEQAHQPAFTKRHPCVLCPSAFRYPKDLRRHIRRVHETTASRPIFDPTYASLGSASMTVSSNLTWESRMPSETSLHFSSNPTSKNASPMLQGQIQGLDAQTAIEPLMLEQTVDMMPNLYLDEDFNLPFQELADFEFDQHDLGDDGFLEMARVRR